jgi:hypothetical protein
MSDFGNKKDIDSQQLSWHITPRSEIKPTGRSYRLPKATGPIGG